ncbi:sigma-54 dependent transcriptional regulator [Desulfonatronospira sp.]|uniref:sigma-54 dependent transcriptional regulator n=1 Tax=Desulfonatronospira sp. TaxID=1962951 RepID=UPI0025C0B784|nr:sigma-54 dependent transcriptional regulator [Desulfonatronospira sp.]
MSSKRILFIARSELISPVLSRLRDEGYELLMSESLDGALKIIRHKSPALVFSQVSRQAYRVQDLLDALDSEEQQRRIIVIAEQGTAQEAQQLLEAGAGDYWLAPLEWEKVKTILPGSAQKRCQTRINVSKPRGHYIIGSHPAMQKVLALARQVASSRASVFISGESGTGKEMFARFLHNNSPRCDGPFIAVNCAALPEHLLESELFGHEKGAFTGAISRKVGKFEMAHQGTILLDEISEMDPALQAKLLRVLQESEIDRVGGTDTVPVDVRVLATTNRNIEECARKGDFRQDLFYRLNVIPLRLPPLRERRDDILLLANHFIRDFSTQYGLPPMEPDQEAARWLWEYDWPGNVRELQNLMERAVLLAGSAGIIRTRHFLLEDEDLQNILEEPEKSSGEDVSGYFQPEVKSDGSFRDDDEIYPIYEMEKRMIIKSLKKTGGNRTQASDLLGISVRTLRNKLSEYKKQGLIIT